MDAEAPPRRRRLFRVLTPLLVIGVALAAGEASLRVFHARREAQEAASLPPESERALIPSRDPALVYELNPGWSDGSFSVNALGLADGPRSRAKPSGTFRIAVVGDSITCGFGFVPRRDGFVASLERRLQQRAGARLRVECLNFGVNGYGIEQLARVAEARVEAFDPDLVVVQLCLNDPYPSDGAYVKRLPRSSSRLRDALLLRVRPARFWAWNLVERAYDATGQSQLVVGLEQLGRLKRPTLAVLFPYLHQPAYADWGFEAYHEMFHAGAAQAGVSLLDLRAAFQAGGRIDGRWPRDPLHPGVEGHAIAAEAIEAELGRRALLPAALR